MTEPRFPDDPTQFHDDGNVYLRQLCVDDIDDRYLAWFRDPVVTEYLDAKNLTYKEVTDYLTAGHTSGGFVMYGIFDRDKDVHIGNIKLGPINWMHGICGCALFIGDPSYWGKGIARQAFVIGTRLAFDKLKMRKITAGVAEGNIGSVKACQAAGWVIEGRLKGHQIINGKEQDCLNISGFNPAFFPEDAQ